MFNLYHYFALGTEAKKHLEAIQTHKMLLLELENIKINSNSNDYYYFVSKALDEEEANQYFLNVKEIIEALKTLKATPSTKINLKKLELIKDKVTSVEEVLPLINKELPKDEAKCLLPLRTVYSSILDLIFLYHHQVSIENEKWKKNYITLWILLIVVIVMVIAPIIITTCI